MRMGLLPKLWPSGNVTQSRRRLTASHRSHVNRFHLSTAWTAVHPEFLSDQQNIQRKTTLTRLNRSTERCWYIDERIIAYINLHIIYMYLVL